MLWGAFHRILLFRPVRPVTITVPTILFSQNQHNWSFMWYKNVSTIFFRFVTNHAFDRQTKLYL